MITNKHLREMGFVFTSRRIAAVGSFILIKGLLSNTERKKCWDIENMRLWSLKSIIHPQPKPRERIFHIPEVIYNADGRWVLNVYAAAVPCFRMATACYFASSQIKS